MEIVGADYYRRREQDQRQWADQASSQSARTLHLDMADRYREMAQEAELNQTGQDRELPTETESAELERRPIHSSWLELIDVKPTESPAATSAPEVSREI